MTTSWGRGDDALTIAALIERGASSWPDRVAVEFGAVQRTYAQLLERATGMAHALEQLGVRRGDAVAIQLPNCAEFVDAWFGASLIGAITVPLNVHLRGDTLRHPLVVAQVQVLVTSTALCDRAAAVASDVPSLRHVLLRETDAAVRLDGLSVATVDEVTAANLGTPLRTAERPRSSDPNLVLFTSGTTGPSKGAVASNHYLVAASLTSYAQKDGRPEDVFWTPLPMSHGNAMIQTLLAPMYHGARAALDERFSVSRFWTRVRDVGATQVSILGSMITMIWNRPSEADDAANPVRVLFGAPMPANIQHAFEERFGVRYVTAYGLSEATPIVISTIDDPPPPGRAGRPYGRFDVRVFDENDREVEVGEVGEIVCRPMEPNVMFDGYLNNPAATQAIMQNLWLHTGDYGRRDADGWIEFVDRKKDYVRRRGENVSSWEVEQVLLEHPDIQDAAAFGVPSEVSEDDLMVAVVPAPGAQPKPDELLEHCGRNLPYFAVPRYVDIVSELPVNELGKVLKTELRAAGVTETTWDADAVGFRVAR